MPVLAERADALEPIEQRMGLWDASAFAGVRHWDQFWRGRRKLGPGDYLDVEPWGHVGLEGLCCDTA